LRTRFGAVRTGVAGFAVALLASAPAVAQDDDWDLRFAPYLWGVGIDGEASVGSARADIDIDFGDIIDMFDGALLGHFEAHKSGMGLFGDFIYLATEPTDQVEFDSIILEAGYLRSTPKQGGISGWELGVRYWDFEITLTPSLFPAVQRSESWADAFIGYRQERPMGQNWRSVVRANIGAGGSDLSWGADLTYLLEFENSNALAVGIKYLFVDYEQSGSQQFGLDANFFGATIGYVFD
jgi:hypothetical protein